MRLFNYNNEENIEEPLHLATIYIYIYRAVYIYIWLLYYAMYLVAVNCNGIYIYTNNYYIIYYNIIMLNILYTIYKLFHY